MPSKPVIILMLLATLLAAGVLGCAASRGTNVAYLLEQDYQRMTNPQLIAYEQELSDEIAAAAGESSSPGVSVGVGFGSWGEHSGVGLGVEKWLGGGGGDAAFELRDRREAVRGEMRKRGLLPPAAGTR